MPTALYRRYRPETFSDVIGQEHVTEPIMQALRTNRVNHAYLFSGPRGCGKTTSARILARCLNCEQGPTPTPCGTCDSCVGLARGGAGTVDVIEIDAASHGGVDDARDLREKASFGPAASRYKVYIIDEAHMVTSQGFNALLKIVEEPPEHVVFVFATTAPEKVISTIRSRTHHYPFRLVPPARLQDYLAQLCESEGVPVDKGVLPLVVRAGGGSVRDSLSVLDQLIAGSDEGGLTYAGAIALLGFTDSALLDDAIEAFAAADGAAVFRVVDKVVESGHEPRRFVEDLLERLRDLLVVSAVPDGASTVLRGLPEDQLERLRQQASRFGTAQLSRAADVVNAGLTELTGATSPRLQMELICARVLLPGADGQNGYGARLDRIERRLAATSAGQPTSGDDLVVPVGGGRAAAREIAREAARGGSREQSGSVVDAPVRSEQAAVQRERPEPAEQPRHESAQQEQPQQEQARQDEGQPRERSDQRGRSGQSGQPTGGPDGPPQQPSRPGQVDVETIRRVWPDVVARLATMRRVTWMMVRDHATVASFDGRRLVLALGNPGVLANFRSGAHTDFVQQSLIDVLGVEVQVEVTAAGPATLPPAAPATSSPPDQAQGEDRPSATGADRATEQPDSDDARSPWSDASPDDGAPAERRSDRPSEPHAPAGATTSAPASEPSGEFSSADQEEPEGWSQGSRPAAASGDLRRPLVDAADDEPSRDDVDAADSGLVGRPVVEQLLGGRVIDESDV